MYKLYHIFTTMLKWDLGTGDLCDSIVFMYLLSGAMSLHHLAIMTVIKRGFSECMGAMQANLHHPYIQRGDSDTISSMCHLGKLLAGGCS